MHNFAKLYFPKNGFSTQELESLAIGVVSNQSCNFGINAILEFPVINNIAYSPECTFQRK